MLKGGSVLTLPKGVKIETSDREDKLVYLDSPAQKSLIDAISLQPSIQQDYQMLLKYYDDAKSTLGITDSFQGKQDRTALSGTAKQFSANRSAGRLESKIKMKQAAYAELFEAIFQYMLAYADEPRVYASIDEKTGEQTELIFSRYDFLEQDEDGNWYYDDDYIFEIDSTSSILSDRQAMWTEVRTSFQSGVFGSPSEYTTLLIYWKQMELLDYPNAGAIYKQLQSIKEDKDNASEALQTNGQNPLQEAAVVGQTEFQGDILQKAGEYSGII